MDCVEGKKKCDVCQLCLEENKSSKADGICRECQEFMCQTCYQHHLKARVCRTHVLLGPGDASISSTTDRVIEKCDKHVNETVRFYCRKHDQIGCGDCMLFDGHGSCQPEYIKDVSINFRQSEEFKRLTNKLQTLEFDKNDVVKKVQSSVESNREMNDELVDDVKSFRKRIDDFFDKTEAENLTFIEKKCSTYSYSLKQIETEFNGISSELEDHKQKLNDKCNTDHALFIHSVTAKSKLQQLESSIEQAKSSCKVDSLKFKPDKQLLEVLSKFNSLGSFEKVSDWDVTCLANEPIPTAETHKSEANYIQPTESIMTYQNIEAGFQSMHERQIRPCPRPLATACSTGGPGGPQMRPSTMNAKPFTGQSAAPARPRMTLPQSDMYMPGRPQQPVAQTMPQAARPGLNQIQNKQQEGLLGFFLKVISGRGVACRESEPAQTTKCVHTGREADHNGAKMSSIKSNETNPNSKANLEGFNVFVEFEKFENRGTRSYLVHPSDAISTLEEKITDKEGIPIHQMRLSLPLLGKELRNELLISDYHIKSGTTINCKLLTL